MGGKKRHELDTERWVLAASILGLALIGACIPPERRGRAIGRWSAASAGAAGIGAEGRLRC